MDARAWRQVMLALDDCAPEIGADLRQSFAAWHRDGRPRDLARYLGLGGCATGSRDRSLARAAVLIARKERLTKQQCRLWPLAEKVVAWSKRSATAGPFFRFLRGSQPPQGGIEAEIFDALLSGAPHLGRRAVYDALKNLPLEFNALEKN